jgi:hypothetical protein
VPAGSASRGRGPSIRWERCCPECWRRFATGGWSNSGDSFRRILNAWTANSTAPNQAAIQSRFTVIYNTTYANTLTAGSGIDWFFYKHPTTSNKKSTDFLN